jgi:hypothetical protein
MKALLRASLLVLLLLGVYAGVTSGAAPSHIPAPKPGTTEVPNVLR